MPASPRAARSGAAAVEFALLAPMLIFLMWGIISYGGYFLTAHTVQQIANDAARAAVGGLDDDERTALANNCVQREVALFGQLQKASLNVSVVNDGKALAVNVLYDASHNPYWAFAQLGPMPSSQVSRTGTVLLGGL